jgi:hypothetical protein
MQTSESQVAAIFRWSESLNTVDGEYLSGRVVGGELVPVFSRFAQAINHPDNLVDFLADFLRPPRTRLETLA